MSRNLILFLIGALIVPAAIFGGSIALESGPVPSDCQQRDVWLRDSNTRFAAAEGVAGSVYRYSGADALLKSVATSYTKAAAAQKASNPPGSDVATNALIVQYYEWMGENWTGWAAQPYLSAHTDLEVAAQAKTIHEAFLASKDHCA